MSNVTEPERTQMTKVLDDGPNHAAGKEPVVENAIQTSRKDEPEKLENPTNPQTQTKKKKSNFGGLKKGFLLNKNFQVGNSTSKLKLLTSGGKNSKAPTGTALYL